MRGVLEQLAERLSRDYGSGFSHSGLAPDAARLLHRRSAPHTPAQAHLGPAPPAALRRGVQPDLALSTPSGLPATPHRPLRIS